jgi:ABC-type cobalamin/Fe3+-siderophores transport system ATPase subunit
MIQTKDLTFSFDGRPIIDSMSVDFRDSAIAGIIGPNGAGKTTLLKLIAGLIQPSNGSILITDRQQHDQKHQDVMWLPSRFEMPFAYSVYDVLEMLLFPWERLSQFNSKDAAIAAALDEVGLKCGKERIFNSLSAGEQHRAMIGAAIVSDATLLLLDEPCANLDIGASHRILKKLRDLSARGKKILLSIHDLQLAYQYCDQFLLLSGTKDVLLGTREKIFESNLLATSFGVKPRFISTGDGTIPIFSDT